jgi:hypothetical protein
VETGAAFRLETVHPPFHGEGFSPLQQAVASHFSGREAIRNLEQRRRALPEIRLARMIPDVHQLGAGDRRQFQAKH